MKDRINEFDLIILYAYNGGVLQFSRIIVLMYDEVYCIFDGDEGLDDLLMGEGDIFFYTLFHCFRILFEEDTAIQSFLIERRLVLLMAIFDTSNTD